MLILEIIIPGFSNDNTNTTNNSDDNQKIAIYLRKFMIVFYYQSGLL